MPESFRWPFGFVKNKTFRSLDDSKFSKKSIWFERTTKSLCDPLRWHANSIFQFYLIPLIRLKKLNRRNSNEINLSNTSIWFTGYREMQNVTYFDFSDWCFRKIYQ